MKLKKKVSAVALTELFKDISKCSLKKTKIQKSGTLSKSREKNIRDHINVCRKMSSLAQILPFLISEADCPC